MNGLIQYLSESALMLGLLTGFYRLFLHQHPMFRFNRFYLLFSLVFAALIPFIEISVPVVANAPTPEFSNLLAVVTVYANQAKANVIPFLTAIPGIKWLYIIGFMGLAVRLMVGFIKLGGLSGKASLSVHKGYKVADLPGQFSPFSFFNVIFINREMYSDEDMDQILVHEMTHVRLKHSWDVILLELLLLVQWFNPFAWLLKTMLKELHEFQADQAVLATGTSIGRYKELLFFQSTGARLLAVNNFNQSLTQKRFKMMTKHISKNSGLIKISMATLLFGFLTFFFACESKVVNDEVNETTETVLKSAGEEVFEKSEVMPEFPGGNQEFMTFIGQSVKYPEEAVEKGISGKAFISFVVNSQGKVVDVKLVRSSGSDLLDQEALRVVKLSPDWKAGENEGKKVSVQYTIPVNFALK